MWGNLAKALVSIASTRANHLGEIIHIVDPAQPTVSEYIAWHNRIAKKRVKAIYIPNVLWNFIFSLVDILFSLKNKRKSTYRYKFSSNSKKLFFVNRVFGQDKLVREYIDWKEAVTDGMNFAEAKQKKAHW